MTHKLFIDRTPGSLQGVMTLQRVGKDGKVVKVFDKMPFNSGQFPFLDGGADDWVQGKGATPFGTCWLSTKRETLTSAEPKGTFFYVLSTVKGERILRGPNGKTRENAGVHLENKSPGTLGCTAVLHDTPERECTAYAFDAYLNKLHKYEPFVETVIL